MGSLALDPERRFAFLQVSGLAEDQNPLGCACDLAPGGLGDALADAVLVPGAACEEVLEPPGAVCPAFFAIVQQFFSLRSAWSPATASAASCLDSTRVNWSAHEPSSSAVMSRTMLTAAAATVLFCCVTTTSMDWQPRSRFTGFLASQRIRLLHGRHRQPHNELPLPY